MVKKLNFVKLAGMWFAHIPDYPGDPSDLVMVEGADVMCDMLDSEQLGIIWTLLYDEEPIDNITGMKTYTLDFVNSTGEEGANYRCREYKLDVWLCNVTKYVFGNFPTTIYIRIT